MAYKIAIASSDGKVINQHFGKATQFLIFDVDDNKDYKFNELLEVTPFCSDGEHEDDRLNKAIERLSGCRAVLVSQIGMVAAATLKVKGIDSFDIHGLIESSLEKLIKYYSKIDGGKNNG
jgi:predicted Fe-Mo cluster-binding NifX family protein